MDALSVYHPGSLEGYRQTRALQTETATTEQLREAMINYRALFEDLTGLRNGHGQPEHDRVAEIRDRAADRDVTGQGLADADNDLAAENGTRTADTPR
jgi:hypothetical protein